MTACPNPTKSRYATRTAAESAAKRVALRLDAPLAPYECVCTWWHLTKRQPEELPRAADASGPVVERLMAIPDIDFREIVAADVRGGGDGEERAALRHRRILKRWRQHLGQLTAEVEQQLKERRSDKSLEGHDWRKKATAHRDSLLLRATECRRLRAEAHEEMQRRDDSRQRDAETAAAMGATAKELQRHAGEIAVHRLITEHRAEFERYVVEEYRALGLEIPDRFEKWTRSQPAA
jgi:hypothetical protein